MDKVKPRLKGFIDEMPKMIFEKLGFLNTEE